MTEKIMDDYPIIGLIASLPRFDLLQTRSIPSIAAQTHELTALVIVEDSAKLTTDEKLILTDTLPSTTISFLENQHHTGVAGTWNTGIDFITSQWGEAYIAILDDDDTWDKTHLQECYATAKDNAWADVVLSNLRMIKSEEAFERPLPTSLSIQDFLAGNPGWQGSNTFIRLDTLVAAGKFTDGLQSTNDRDLAIRVLEKEFKISFTNKHTASWYCAERKDALSASKSPQKLIGLAQFYALHKNKLKKYDCEVPFFDRAEKLFGFAKEEILSASE
jgi:glycosyltransferase involved in cell wall biosynthesis